MPTFQSGTNSPTYSRKQIRCVSYLPALTPNSTLLTQKKPLMEQIAGATGFLPEIIRPHVKHALSFDEIERLRPATLSGGEPNILLHRLCQSLARTLRCT